MLSHIPIMVICMQLLSVLHMHSHVLHSLQLLHTLYMHALTQARPTMLCIHLVAVMKNGFDSLAMLRIPSPLHAH